MSVLIAGGPAVRRSGGPVGVALGTKHLLVVQPGALEMDLCVVGEQLVASGLLFVGEQVGAEERPAGAYAGPPMCPR